MGYIHIADMAKWNTAWYGRDLAGQVQAIRNMHSHGASIVAISYITGCSPEFIVTLVA